MELINTIEAELKLEYVGGAIAWADKNRDGAWSKAMDRFDCALKNSIERQDYRSAEIEGQFYKATVLQLLREYKQTKGLNDAESFLSALVPA
jgi:hypothetical protein